MKELEYSGFGDSLGIGSKNKLGLGIVRFLTWVTWVIKGIRREADLLLERRGL